MSKHILKRKTKSEIKYSYLLYYLEIVQTCACYMYISLNYNASVIKMLPSRLLSDCSYKRLQEECKFFFVANYFF